jgi:hypothetical protein
LEIEGYEEDSKKRKISMTIEREIVFSYPLKTRESKGGEKIF